MALISTLALVGCSEDSPETAACNHVGDAGVAFVNSDLAGYKNAWRAASQEA